MNTHKLMITMAFEEYYHVLIEEEEINDVFKQGEL